MRIKFSAPNRMRKRFVQLALIAVVVLLAFLLYKHVDNFVGSALNCSSGATAISTFNKKRELKEYTCHTPKVVKNNSGKLIQKVLSAPTCLKGYDVTFNKRGTDSNWENCTNYFTNNKNNENKSIKKNNVCYSCVNPKIKN